MTHVSFFANGPDEPPLVAQSMDQIPRIGDTVLLRAHYAETLNKYKVEDVEWVPSADTVYLEVRPVTSFG